MRYNDSSARTAPSVTGDAGDAIASVGLTRIDHVGIAVSDLDQAIDFYTRVLGMRCVHQEINEEQGVREAMLAVGPAGGGDGGDGGSQIQLLAPLTPDSVLATFLDRRGPGMHQIAYTVSDIEQTSSALRERGLRLIYPQSRAGTAGSRVNFIHPKDAGGVLVELVEPAAADQH